MQYLNELKTASKRSKMFGIPTKFINPCNDRFISDDRLNELISSIQLAYGEIKLEKFIFRCAHVHLEFLPHCKKIFHPDALFTLGFIRSNKSEFYKFTENDIKNWIEKGVNFNKMDFHAWITLPSMEIIDLTISSTLAAIYKWKEFGLVIADHVADLKNMSYHPMLVGEDSVYKIGAAQLVVQI